jgi:signal transduction histidine kinase
VKYNISRRSGSIEPRLSAVQGAESMAFEVPVDEPERIRALFRYEILDTPSEVAFDHITRLTATLLGVPIALISLVDTDRQWFKSKIGLDLNETSRDISFCSHAILQDGPFVVPDATLENRFADNPLVTGEPGIRFYAGAPLRTPDGHQLGTLCVIDTAPRHGLSEFESNALVALAKLVVDEMELRSAERKLVQQQGDLDRLREIEVLKDEFISTVSHELRTPLTSIIASLGLLADGAIGPLDAQVQEVVNIALTNSERLVHLVDDILDYERMEISSTELELTLVSAAAMVDSAIMAVDGTAAERNIQIVGSTEAADDVIVECDPRRVIQVLINLIGNAIKFSPHSSTISLQVEIVAPSAVRFSVIDQGHGIDEDMLPKLFEPFWQVDSSASRTVGGSGLGLAISRRIAEQHDGRIEVTSSRGIGSTFSVILPLRQP